MMKEEFEERAGIRVNGDEYEEIEACYMNAIPVVDKDKFVKRWLRDGGIQGIIDKRGGLINRARLRAEEAEHERDRANRESDEMWSKVCESQKEIKRLNEEILRLNSVIDKIKLATMAA
jgi:hypothetical protein